MQDSMNVTTIVFSASIFISIFGPMIAGIYLFKKEGFPLRRVITNSLWMAAFAFLVGFFWSVIWLISDLPKEVLPATLPIVVFVFFYVIQRIFFKEVKHQDNSQDVHFNDDEEDQGKGLLAYDLAKSIAIYFDTIVLVGSGKTIEQRIELTDVEKYAANIMMIIAANRVANYFHQNPTVVHLAILVNFWKDIYSAEELPSLQNEIIEEFNGLLLTDKEVLENISNIFWELGQRHDIKLVEQLGEIYRMWVEKLSA